MPAGKYASKEVEMADLVDYSGKFKPNLRYEDFSKDTLVKLLYEYARTTNVLDGEYTTEIMTRHGQKEALDSQYKVWERHGPRVMRWIQKTLRIQGNDVPTYFKCLQVVPSFSPEHYDIKWEVKSPEHGIFTVTRCKFLDEMERAGLGFEKLICGKSEPASLQMLAEAINPNMVATPLKLPPRKGKEGICCQFDFKIKPTK